MFKNKSMTKSLIKIIIKKKNKSGLQNRLVIVQKEFWNFPQVQFDVIDYTKVLKMFVQHLNTNWVETMNQNKQKHSLSKVKTKTQALCNIS